MTDEEELPIDREVDADLAALEDDEDINKNWHPWHGVRVAITLARIIVPPALGLLHDIFVEVRHTRTTLDEIHDTLKQMQVFHK
jgi:hypothetical protein